MKIDPFKVAYDYLERSDDNNFELLGQEQEIALPPRAWVVDKVRAENGTLRAVEICSAPLEDHLWVISDRDFEPRDGLAIYYAEEIPLLRNKTTEELRGIHKVKLAFPGCRVIQEGPER